MIIGLTGSFAAGKDTVAEYLIEKGFRRYVFSDLIRAELARQGKPAGRENFRAMGNWIRETYGSGELSRRLLQAIAADGAARAVVVGLRNPSEVEKFRRRGDFQLWFVDAPVEVRYARTASRGRSDDFKSLEDFIQNERAEDTNDPNGMQFRRLAAMADATIINDKDVAHARAQVDVLLDSLEKKR